MRVCSNCNAGYPDDYAVCPRCGNTNLVYVQGNGLNRSSNLYIGQFLKHFFHAPSEAKSILAQKKDYGSACIVAGAELFAYLLFAIFFNVGMGVRYDMEFNGLTAFLYPFVFFIIIFGFQYLNVLLYYCYSKRRLAYQRAVPGSILINLASSRVFPVMIVLFASLVSIGSPIMGISLASVTAVITLIYTGIMTKLEYGVKPKSLLDSFMFILLGAGFYILGAVFILLLVKAGVESMVMNSFARYFY